MGRADGEYRTLVVQRRPPMEQARRAEPAVVVPVVKTKPFSVVFEKYLAENKERQPRTQSQIRSGFLKFLAAIGGDKPVGEITREHGRTYKEAMLAKNLGAASVNKYLHGLSHCLEWANGPRGMATYQRPGRTDQRIDVREEDREETGNEEYPVP